MLERLTKAPLKPQQRLYATRVYIVPKYHHQLALGVVRISTLRKMDKILRAAARRWLSLPHDTPVGYFHAGVAFGGLGLNSFRWRAPLHRVARLGSLGISLEAERTETGNYIRKEISKALDRLNDHGVAYDDGNKVAQRWKEKLYNSVDGRGL